MFSQVCVCSRGGGGMSTVIPPGVASREWLCPGEWGWG